MENPGCRDRELKKMEVKYCHKAAENNDITDFPYVCTAENENFRCNQRSKSKELLALHVNLEHNDFPLFECDQCNKKLRFFGPIPVHDQYFVYYNFFLSNVERIFF
jgi:hypothetical protein